MSNTPRKPALTEKRIVALLGATDMAQADMDADDGDHPSRQEIKEAYDFVRELASWWAAKHGGRWPGSKVGGDK